MRTTLLASAMLLGMGATGAYAQGTSATQFPPSPGASSQGVQPTNSLPAGGGSANAPRAGQAVGTVAVGSPPAVAPVMPAPMPPRRMVHMRHAPMAQDGVDATAGAPPTGAYRGGAGSPSSTRASNITSADTHSEIAPRLPEPGAAANTPEALLAVAQRSLDAGRTGAAQQALEMAETRMLTRSTDPSMANAPDPGPRVKAIGDARRALGMRDIPGAKAAIQAAMSGA